MREQRVSKVIRIHPLGTTNICTKRCGICLVDVEIFHCISEYFDLLVALHKRPGGQGGLMDSSSGNREFLYKTLWHISCRW